MTPSSISSFPPFLLNFIRVATLGLGNFKSVNFFQPGHIMGNKFRADILFADAVSIFFNPFLIGDFRKFRSISIRDLPQFVVNKTNEEKEGINYYDYNSIVRRNNY